MRRLGIACVLFAIIGLLLSPAFAAEKAPPPPKVLEFVPGSWSLAVLPDTQKYSRNVPGLYTAQTHWIARHKQQFNIQYVLHMGDVTDRNTPLEWQRAGEAMHELDGVVPYALASGNHDVTRLGKPNAPRDTLLNRYFPPADFKKWPTFGGLMREDDLQNSYHLFSAGGADWLILALEWAPRNETVAWANAVLDKFPRRKTILITHAYMYFDDTRYDYLRKGKFQINNPHAYRLSEPVNDGQELWDKLVKMHNVPFVFSGHTYSTGSARLTSKNAAGRSVHQILSDYQFRLLGGEAYLRLVEFLPDGKTVHVKTYSPLYDRYLTEPDQQFILKVD
jgi:hypothetical protein